MFPEELPEDIRGDPDALTQEDCERSRRCDPATFGFAREERGCAELSLPKNLTEEYPRETKV